MTLDSTTPQKKRGLAQSDHKLHRGHVLQATLEEAEACYGNAALVVNYTSQVIDIRMHKDT